MEIKIVGQGCNNCKKLEANAREAMKKFNCNCEINKIIEFSDIAASGVVKTPGLIIENTIHSQGQVLSVDQILKIFGDVC